MMERHPTIAEPGARAKGGSRSRAGWRACQAQSLTMLTAGAWLAACGNTLVDHNADPALLEIAPTCGDGFQSCGSGCFPDTDVICDRSTCAVCDGPESSVARCENAACAFDCIGDTRLCPDPTGASAGGLCLGESTLVCGPECLACPEPVGGFGAGVCVAGAAVGHGHCEIACDSQHHLCGQACVLEGAASCGAACADCRPGLPAHATAVCTAAHTCGFSCEPGYLRCGDACCETAQVAAGARHTCALTTAGGLLCWGANDAGQLGDGSTTDRPFPVEVFLSGSNVTRLAAGAAHTCALVDGALFCWGSNVDGQLGVVASPGSTTPRAVVLANVRAIAASGYLDAAPAETGRGHTCAATDAGALYCWGENSAGQLGVGDTTSRASPTVVSGVTAATATSGSLALGARHTCVRTAAGGLACWGERLLGKVGDGSAGPAPALAPVNVRAGNVGFVAAGGDHTCLVDTATAGDPECQCWGSDAMGQIGADGPGFVAAPTALAVGGGLASLRLDRLAAGRAHTCMLRLGDIGGLKCFGANNEGQLALPASTEPGAVSDVPLAATNLAVVVAAGGDHTCAVLADGMLVCWGDNRRGQLGDGTLASRATPTPVNDD